MTKIAIITCGEVLKKCTMNGCMKAFNNKKDSFERYKNEDIKFASIGICNGCGGNPIEELMLKIEKFKAANVDIIHLSTCIRGRCENYETFGNILLEHFNVVGYTHGSKSGKKNNNIDFSK